MTDSSEPYEPIPPRHGITEEWASEPKPVCPICGTSVRRNLDETGPGWRCDLDGPVRPIWTDPKADGA